MRLLSASHSDLPHPLVAPVRSALGAAIIAVAVASMTAGCGGMHETPAGEPPPAPSSGEPALDRLLASFGQPMHLVTPEPVPSIAAPGSTFEIWVSEHGMGEFMNVRLDRVGSQAALPVGTVILRVVRGQDGQVTKYTALSQREEGFAPPMNLWFAQYDLQGRTSLDAKGKPIEGNVAACAGCHLGRSADGWVFGMPAPPPL